jgi:uncharacterized protein
MSDENQRGGFMGWVRRNSPRREELLESRWVRPFAHRVAHSHLWRFTRTSVPRGVALGLFVGIFLLIPGIQILGVALLALPVRANIPIGAAMTFLSNPATTPFILASSVWIGNWTFGLHADISTFKALWVKKAAMTEWAQWFLSDTAPAMLAGLFIISALAAVAGYVLASVAWDNWIRMRWRRKLARGRADKLL